MSLGIVMLVHAALERAEQLARHWATAKCPVVIHVDKQVTHRAYDAFVKKLSDLPNVTFSKRYLCDWGSFGIVAATQSASELMLADFPQVQHVYLASGSCLPLRPVRELITYLSDRPQTDFIESATTADVPWTVGGLDAERFTLHFPFSWKRQRFLFDRYVALQRFLRLRRKVPDGLVPHMGSQWWCLTRQTLSAILQDSARQQHDSFFRRVWIPDESYFQTLARRHATDLESRSLTLSKFDHHGKPHLFYDDHLQLLRRSRCFVARKIWPHANGLYDAFLTEASATEQTAEPDPTKIDRIFSKAVDRRSRGRPGLYMQSRFPRNDHASGTTAAPYSILQGFSELFDNFEPWLARATGARIHGHLFAPEKAFFAADQTVIDGALSDSAKLRDYNPQAYLTNLIWNTRGERQCFQFGPSDKQQINWIVANDANAHISIITGAWAVALFRSNEDFATVRKMAAQLQKTESKQLEVLRSTWVKARVRVWTLAEFNETPMELLQPILAEMGATAPHRLPGLPRMTDLTGFSKFLQNLKNQGMHPYLAGDFPIETGMHEQKRQKTRKPYIVRETKKMRQANSPNLRDFH